MRAKPSLLILLAVSIALPLLSPRASGFGANICLTAFTGANVALDGNLGPGEWSDGDHLSFGWAEANSGNSSLTAAGNVWVKANGTHLLLAVSTNGRAERSTGSDEWVYTMSVLFDDDNDGNLEGDEDAPILELKFTSTTTEQNFTDAHYDTGLGRYNVDSAINGSGVGDHSNPGPGSGDFVWEFARPLNGDAQDFILADEAAIGFELVYSYVHVTSTSRTTGWAYWTKTYPDGLPQGPAPSANPWPVIIRSNTQCPTADNAPPTIGNPTYLPESPDNDDGIEVHYNVTDLGSGVNSSRLVYTTDSWRSVNTTLSASYNMTSSVATVLIPAQSLGAEIHYYLEAFDKAGNKARNDNSGAYFVVNVPVPLYLQLWFLIAIAAASVGIIALVILARRRSHKPVPNAGTG